MQSIGIGCAPPDEGNQQQPNGCIKSVRMWNYLVSTAFFKSITT
jgi:hypothetical protein